MECLVCEESLSWLGRKAHSESVDLIYIDPPFNTGRNRKDYRDNWASMEDYGAWLHPFLVESKRVLKSSGNLLVHLDQNSVHYAKKKLDELFGRNQFRNEIIWKYSSGGASKRTLAKKHDNILWYTKSDEYKFNVLREPYATPNVRGRKGFHPDGRMLTDVWDISIISTTSKERVGYESQKPLALLERIVEVFSDEGDLVLDFFCGSGTTGVAACGLGRDFVLIDSNPEAVEKAKGRLCKVQLRKT